jgi:tetratricopeptide (TPR) repeat protein
MKRLLASFWDIIPNIRNKLLILLSVVLIVVVGVYFVSQKRPPIETRFVQNIREQESGDRVQDNGEKTDLIIKEPGDYALLTNPKHIYQTFNNCGPATLSMILSWYGQDVSQRELGDKMRPYQNSDGNNDDKTIFTHEFVDWAKKYGLESIGRVNGDIELLKTFTANGIPVVVKTWLHVGEDIGHFRIVRGFDEREAAPFGRQVIIQDDSYEGPNKKISYFDFLSMWQPFNYAYIIVYTPEQKDLVDTIIGEESNENVALQNAFTRAQKEAELDTENVYPHFNISTSYYHLGDYQKSAEAYERIENQLPRRMLWYQIEPIQAYIALGNYNRAFQISDNILANGNRAFSELYQLKGEYYLSIGDDIKAKEQFELALLYNENFEPAKMSLESLLNN